ncbi:nitroreductase family protein [Mycena vitilis]|nr:nitroreductase family protein [Mycena vitilis]
MSDAFLAATATRRTNYAITPKSSISDEKLEAIIKHSVLHSPTPFNIQSSRAVLILGEGNTKLWKMISEYALKGLEGKTGMIHASLGEMKATIQGRMTAFSGGYGSVLFFEDQTVVDAISAKMPHFSKQLPVWSTNATGMLQHAVWTALTLEGLGASLQHNGAYSDELVAEIQKTWGLPATWTSTAIMPFGVPAAASAEKQFGPIEPRVKVFKA